MENILVCGSRDWNNYAEIYNFLKGLDCEFNPKEITIIEGDCSGADRLAGTVAKVLGYGLIICPADWKKHGKSAGPIRNQEMLDKYKPSMVVAFHNDYEHSKGTKDMCEKAKLANIYTVLVSANNIETLGSRRFTVGEAFTKAYLDSWGVSEDERKELLQF